MTRSQWIRWIAALGLCAAAPGGAFAADEVGLTEMVEIMREEGVIDDAQYAGMRSRAEKREAKTSWTDRLSFTGDLRVRIESFLYREDALGNDDPNRVRARYRVRLGATAQVNDHLDAVFRLASGQGDSRSANQTLGHSLDFDPDDIFIDRAYLHYRPRADGGLPGGETGSLWLQAGRVPNPFTWKASKDYLTWDHDIALEGATAHADWSFCECGSLYLNTGYYVVQERGGGSDPSLISAQIGTDLDVMEKVRAGGRVTYLGFHNLDGAFFTRGVSSSAAASAATNSGGNTSNGFAFGLSGDRWVDVVEGSLYATFGFLERWPVTVFAHLAHNLSAQDLGGGKRDLGWIAGLHTGDKTEFANLGFHYGVVEADYYPSQFMDSDFTDGRTNREGFSFWGTREILPSTDFTLEFFNGWELADDVPNPADSLTDARRWRIRGDVQVKF